MKDLYSFDKSVEDAYATYDQVAQAYSNIFRRIGSPFVVAEADSGNIGGSKSHEYHLLSSVGEDTLLTCKDCGYTANEELAEAIYHENDDNINHSGSSTNDDDTNKVLQRLELHSPSASKLQVTTLIYSAQGTSEENNISGSLAVITPYQRAANLLKVHAALGKYLEAEQTINDRATLELKVVAPDQWLNKSQQQSEGAHVFLDDAIKDRLTSPSATQTTTVHDPLHFRLAEAGDGCRKCNGITGSSRKGLESVKAIEVAHTFYLGTKYSSVLNCTFQDHTPQQQKKGGHQQAIAAEMGCYGIGISRLLASVAESKTDNRGLVWPSSIAPYKVCIIPTDDKRDEFKAMANTVYDQINGLSGGWSNDIVIDDRRAGFGRKMTDAEMVGFPWIVVIGRKAFNEQEPMVEVHQRRQGAPNLKADLPLHELNSWLVEQNRQHTVPVID
ncbi:hypothetical protein BCR42DRAFT_327315 [Absidia repens]|uniref:Anticodon-binding domain-containing protein n=1 Tax=Absidia repens TaxID=90262 RepID=A0A1X2IHB2_9FUNG|nr:hypothetical protein BCR42DRAFT_327315 [Absidia repens]